MVVLLKNLNNTLVLPPSTLTHQGSHQLRRHVVKTFSDYDSERKLVFFREPGTTTFGDHQRFLIAHDVLPKTVASRNGHHRDTQFFCGYRQHQSSTRAKKSSISENGICTQNQKTSLSQCIGPLEEADLLLILWLSNNFLD